MSRLMCVLHGHLRFMFQTVLVLCCVSGRFFRYKFE